MFVVGRDIRIDGYFIKGNIMPKLIESILKITFPPKSFCSVLDA